MRKNLISGLLILSLALGLIGALPANVARGADSTAGKLMEAYDVVTLGTYPQSKVTDENLIEKLEEKLLPDNTGVTYQGKRYAVIAGEKGNAFFLCEPVVWIVLERSNDSMLLMSRDIIAAAEWKQADNSTQCAWEDSDVRTWMRGTLYNQLFNAAEQKKILSTAVTTMTGATMNEYIYLPSREDMKNSSFGFSSDSDRRADGTDYAKAVSVQANRIYFLRETFAVGLGYVRVVNGGALYYGFTNIKCGIRPCIRVRADSVEPWKLSETAYTAATCETDGNIGYYTDGTRCFKDEAAHQEIAKEETVLHATGHNWGQWKVETKATCDADGKQVRFCKNDKNHTQTQTIKKLGHDYRLESTKDATCTESGTRTYVCFNDSGHTYTEAIKPTGHNLTLTAAKQATCETDGNKAYYTCSNCGMLFLDAKATRQVSATDMKIEKLGHDWGAWVTVKEPSASQPGSKIRTCKRDSSHTETAAIQPEGGSPVTPDTPVADDVNWSINNGVLTIHGTGRMDDYNLTNFAPWFDRGQEIKKIVVENGITYIGEYAFCGTSAVSVSLPETVMDIGGDAFQGCIQLQQIKLPQGLTRISEELFMGCSALSSLDIPSSVTEIGDFAFLSCTAMQKITVPASVTEIGMFALGYVSQGEGSVENAHSLIIYGYTDTEANRYADRHNLTFVPLDGIDPSAAGFIDVKPGAFYEKAVDWAVEKDITKGTSEITFSPEDYCTRGNIVTFLWRAKGSPAPKSTECPFLDVTPTSYYYQAMLWAVENGITKGLDDTHFGPTSPCTRAQAVTFLWRTAGAPAPKSTDTVFTDVNISGFYYKAMLWAGEQNITKGVTASAFGPEDTCTRGHIVTFLYRSFAG